MYARDGTASLSSKAAPCSCANSVDDMFAVYDRWWLARPEGTGQNEKNREIADVPFGGCGHWTRAYRELRGEYLPIKNT